MTAARTTESWLNRWPIVAALVAAAILVGGALALWITRGDALLLDLAGAVRSAFCL